MPSGEPRLPPSSEVSLSFGNLLSERSTSGALLPLGPATAYAAELPLPLAASMERIAPSQGPVSDSSFATAGNHGSRSTSRAASKR